MRQSRSNNITICFYPFFKCCSWVMAFLKVSEGLSEYIWFKLWFTSQMLQVNQVASETEFTQKMPQRLKIHLWNSNICIIRISSFVFCIGCFKQKLRWQSRTMWNMISVFMTVKLFVLGGKGISWRANFRRKGNFSSKFHRWKKKHHKRHNDEIVNNCKLFGNLGILINYLAHWLLPHNS